MAAELDYKKLYYELLTENKDLLKKNTSLLEEKINLWEEANKGKGVIEELQKQITELTQDRDRKEKTHKITMSKSREMKVMLAKIRKSNPKIYDEAISGVSIAAQNPSIISLGVNPKSFGIQCSIQNIINELEPEKAQRFQELIKRYINIYGSSSFGSLYLSTYFDRAEGYQDDIETKYVNFYSTDFTAADNLIDTLEQEVGKFTDDYVKDIVDINNEEYEED